MKKYLGVEGIHVYVLYPKGKVSKIQESQFTTLGQNITAIEVDGVFDDCQALVKAAFMDQELNAHMRLTSANSINVARFLPQSFYYFNAYARMKERGLADKLVACVPSGNFGNICSALFGKKMGLPISRFIAANNANDIFYKYLCTGKYEPKTSNEAAYRSITLSWFRHSAVGDLFKALGATDYTIVLTTDHGSIRCYNPIKVVGDKNTNTNLRYKLGKSLTYNKKEVFEIRDPHKAGLPSPNLSTAYIFATGDDFFAYPNNYNYYVQYYKDTFQHGGVSMEEMLIPLITLHGKKRT